jgi:tetratricopeptide (TPR) repeat protein
VGNVENVDQPPAERQAAGERLWREAGLSLPGGLLTRPAVERLDLVQRVLLSLQEPLGVPTSFLLDSRRRLRAIYKGPPDNQQLRHDLQLLGSDDPRDYRDLAVPFAGHWYINPAPADLLALPRELLQTGDAAEAYAYLQRHIGTSQRPGGEADADWFAIFDAALADTYTQAGIELARQQHAADGREALRTALQVEPDRWQTLAALASLSSQQGRNREALATFQRMHELRPNDMLVANNLAWILATSRDDALRDPAQAVKLAEAVCDATQYRVLTALDTLAAAYAAAGRFDDAVRVAEQALSLAGPDNKSQAPRQRLEAYRQGKAYRE